jgi:radical SAM superfamily enzyme YgiQ (UPF0313 family)
LADIAALPPPDRELFMHCPDFTLERTIVGHEFAASRGCPFRCTYCENDGLRALYGKAHLRRLPVEAVVAEVEGALDLEPRVSIVGFHDDVFTTDPAWLTAFCRAWRSRIRRPFWVNAHPDMLPADRVRALAAAGCVRVHLGLESGSEELRRRVLGRPLSDETIVAAAGRLRQAGIRIVTFVMLGIPGENEGSYRETVALLRRVRPDWIIQSYYVPLPGTPLGESCRALSPITTWESLHGETLHGGSFYQEPRRSWASALTARRLGEMGTALVRDVYEE